MSVVGHKPMLRLVDGAEAPPHPVLRRADREVIRARSRPAIEAAAERVRRENVSAASLPASDSRWLLAVQIAQALEGGRAAILPPERRQRLVSLATRLGVGSFDANLVIAIVQDAARHGEGALSPATMSRLTLVRSPRDLSEARPMPHWASLLAAAALGGVIALALVHWIAG